MTPQKLDTVSLAALGLALVLAIACGWFAVQNHQLTQELAAAQHRIDQLADDKAQLQRHLTDLETRSQSLRTSLADFHEQQSTLSGLVESLHSELQQVSGDYQKLTETQQTTQERLENARKRLEELSRQEAARTGD